MFRRMERRFGGPTSPPCGLDISPNQCGCGACPAGMTYVNQPGGCYGHCGCQ